MINCPKCGQEYCTPVKYHVCGLGYLVDKSNQKAAEKEFEELCEANKVS